MSWFSLVDGEPLDLGKTLNLQHAREKKREQKLTRALYNAMVNTNVNHANNSSVWMQMHLIHTVNESLGHQPNTILIGCHIGWSVGSRRRWRRARNETMRLRARFEQLRGVEIANAGARRRLAAR
jgi:hypothetical protein